MATTTKATLTCSIQDKTETTISIKWSSDSIISALWYSTDNGDTWKERGVNPVKSGVCTISGLTHNTYYVVRLRIKGKDASAVTESDAMWTTTYSYPYCIDANEFTIGKPTTLTFYNPLNRTFDFTIIANGHIIHTWKNIKGTSYTGVDGEPAVTNLYNSINNLQLAKFVVSTTCGGVTLQATDSYYYYADYALCKPTFLEFDYKDANTNVVNVTGNNKVLVVGVSTLSIQITSANKMTANKGATPDVYRVFVGDYEGSIEYADGDIDATIGTVYGSDMIRVYATDSRNFSTLAQKRMTVLQYDSPRPYVTVKRKNNFENETTLSVKGEISPLVVNGTNKNAVTSIKYRRRETGTTSWSTYTTLSYTVSGNTATCTDVVLDLDNSKSYEFEVVMYDKLSSGTTKGKVGIGQAIFMVSSNKKLCYMNGKQIATVDQIPTVQSKSTIVGYAHPVGSVFITSTNTNPYTILGVGSWTLIDKEFTPSTANTKDFFDAAELVTNGGGYLVRGGHSIRVRQLVTIDVQLDDSDFLVGSFIWTQMGISDIPADMIERMSFSDGANGGIVYYIANGSGNVTVKDVFDAPTTSGKKFYMDFVIVVDHTRMSDNYCNKFYWQRTS